MQERITYFCDGQTINGTLEIPMPGVPCVVMSHGLESTGDGDEYPILSHMLASHGIASFRITHRGCTRGSYVRESNIAHTLKGRIDDLYAAIEFLGDKRVDLNRLGGLGTSFGGMAILGSAQGIFKVLALIGTPCTILPMGIDPLPLDPEIDNEMQQYDFSGTIKKFPNPVLIVHGDSDAVVPSLNAHTLYQNANNLKRMELIAGADHVFSEPLHRRTVNEMCVDWFRAHLLGS